MDPEILLFFLCFVKWIQIRSQSVQLISITPTSQYEHSSISILYNLFENPISEWCAIEYHMSRVLLFPFFLVVDRWRANNIHTNTKSKLSHFCFNKKKTMQNWQPQTKNIYLSNWITITSKLQIKYITNICKISKSPFLIGKCLFSTRCQSRNLVW